MKNNEMMEKMKNGETVIGRVLLSPPPKSSGLQWTPVDSTGLHWTPLDSSHTI